MNCPSCGAEIDSDHSLAQLIVCQYCNSAIVLDEKATRVAGKMAVLAQTPGPFYVGGGGSYRNRRFRVLGRVRYGYSKGFWDEWYVEFDGGTTAWISEDKTPSAWSGVTIWPRRRWNGSPPNPVPSYPSVTRSFTWTRKMLPFVKEARDNFHFRS